VMDSLTMVDLVVWRRHQLGRRLGEVHQADEDGLTLCRRTPPRWADFFKAPVGLVSCRACRRASRES
jgi:hypothetical protein